MVAFCFAGSLQTAQACVCSGPAVNDREDAAAEFRDAAVVFEGEVSASPKEIVAPTGSQLGLGVIEFRVLRTYKGNLGDSIQLFDSMAGTDCGGDSLRPGQKLFVYGFEDKEHKIYIEACTRTTLLEFAGPDIRFARNERPTKEDLAPPGEKWRLKRDPTLETRGAIVKGFVRRSDGGDVSNVFLTLWDGGKEGRRIGVIGARERVKRDGSFEIRFLAPGQYNLTAEDRQNNSTTEYLADYGNVTLTERQVLSDLVVNLHPEPLGSVRVKVLAPPELHDRVFVRLTEIDSDGKFPAHYGQTASLDAQSSASFDSVPYGHYSVYVLLTGDDISKPSWIHDEVQIELNRNQAEAVVKLRKAHDSDHG